MHSICHSEAVYNVNLVFPCIKAILEEIEDNPSLPFFVDGEEELAAMTIQLTRLNP